MTALTSPDPRRAEVRRLVADTLLLTAQAAIKNGAHVDDVATAMLATAINCSLDAVPARQVARELRRMADEVEQLPFISADKRPN